MKRLIGFMLLWACPLTAADADLSRYYKIENIAMPPGLSAENGGVAFTPSGKVVTCWHHGEVYVHNPATGTWTLYAEGLQNPLGILAPSETEIIVLQQSELTALRDTDGDGAADHYRTLHDGFGMTGNYHEFSFGPAADAQGNLYIAHGLASSGGGAGYRHELRGRFNPISSSGSKFACVPWRGWVCKIAPDGTMTPFASGLREPNGIGFDLKGNLWVADNQGDWVGTSKLHHIREGRFYGHPSSLAWRDDLNLTEDPIRLPVEKLDAMRTPAAVLLPHGILANSPTQPLCDDTEGQFGPFAGQLLIGEMNAPRLIRVMLDEVDGAYQGACTSFYEGAGLRMGNNRMAFAPDGSLWVGQTQRKGKWVGDSGLQRLTWTGAVPPAIASIRLTATGFDVQFTRSMQLNNAKCSVNRFRYAYHAKYGSDQLDKASVDVTTIKPSADRLSASITLAELKAGFVHEITLEGAVDDEGAPMLSPTLYYTLNRLRKP